MLWGFPQLCWLQRSVEALFSREWGCATWMRGWTWLEGHGELSRLVAGAGAGPKAACCMLGWAVVCPVHQASWPGNRALFLPSWCIGSSYLFLDVSYSCGKRWVNGGCQAKPSQSANWGAETCAEHKSVSPCPLAIPAFDRITGLYNRHLNSNRGICLRQRF